MPLREHRVLDAAAPGALIRALQRREYRVLGPRVRDAAIVYDELHSAADLPVGWSDAQAPGIYRVVPQEHKAYFAYGNGPHSWKKYLHPAETTLFTATRENGSFRIVEAKPADARALAFLGVHACDLAAMARLEKALSEGGDPGCAARRRQTFIVAIQCLHAGGACFCAAMKTGPRVGEGFDLVLAEMHGPPHRFLAAAGTERGAEVLAELESASASADDLRELEQGIERAAQEQARKLDSAVSQEVLARAFDDARWDNIAARCLGCGNCTAVCPTCFCTTLEDGSDVTGRQARRCRRWDSCFNTDFSYIHGGSIRASLRARYRQWLSHKLGAWIDQFGSHGCVGCGRCVTWCPVGIDLAEEFHALQEAQHGNA